MSGRLALLLTTVCVASLSAAQPRDAPATPPPNTALTNGLWFDGTSFERRTVYSVDGHFTFSAPPQIETTLDLSGSYVVPPFAEAHNHNIGTGIEAADRQTIQRYLAAGVVYVQILGNLPLDRGAKHRLGLNRPEGLDVVFAQGSLTGTGGHPAGVVELMLTRGLFPGHTPETLRDHRYFTVDSVPDLERKWPKVMALEPDIIKLFLVHSESYAARKDDPEFYGLRGLDPALVPEIAAKARAAGRRVAAHVETPADFRSAIGAGVDEIVHVPRSGVLTQEDAELAARHGTILITTLAVVSARPTPEQSASELQIRLRNLELLLNAGANVVIGSDAVADTSRAETEFLLESGVVDELALLRLWTGATPRAIFPDRRIGALAEGYEASFVALGGNPLEDWRNVRDVDVLFKQGRVIELPDAAP